MEHVIFESMRHSRAAVVLVVLTFGALVIVNAIRPIKSEVGIVILAGVAFAGWLLDASQSG